MAEKSFPDFLQEFAALGPEVRDTIVAAFESGGPAISIEALAARISRNTSISSELFEGFITAIAPLVDIVASGSPEAKDRFISILTRIAEKKENRDDLDPRLFGQFSRLLVCETAIGLTAKAQNIMWGHGKIFADAKSLSQARPLFLSDLKHDVEYAVIVHELRLEYKCDGENSSICLVMDSDKIEELKRVLDRALMKEQALRAVPAFRYLIKE